MSDTQRMSHVFAILEPHDVLTNEVIGGLRRLFDERDISEIGAMKVHKLAAEIATRRGSVDFPSDAQSGMVARALLNFMRDMEFVSAQSVGTAPQIVKVVRDKAPAEMNCKELLTSLVETPSDYHDLLPFIEQQPLVSRAARRSPNWAVLGSDKKLDVDATMDRLQRLAEHSIIQPKMPDGRYPVPLARAFGRDERYLLNPFASSLDEAAVRGPIFQDYDLGNLDEEIHLTYIWAAFVANQGQGHQAWPKQIDPYDHLSQAFAEEPSGRWREIVEDYRAAKANGDPSTEGLTRYVRPEDLRGRLPFGGEPERDEKWYREQLEAVASRAIDQINRGVRVTRKVIWGVRTTNGGVILNDAIVLDHIITTNGPIRGRAYVPYGTIIETTNNNVSQDVFERSWKQLYEKAVELGLIEA